MISKVLAAVFVVGLMVTGCSAKQESKVDEAEVERMESAATRAEEAAKRAEVAAEKSEVIFNKNLQK
jgi:uncharacterized protein YcfL